ncbi:MAG: hypothetical protein HY288_04265 [Planctomycetia bacterium]|nr:hypothetical protein [Planctomycetia bacterium]
MSISSCPQCAKPISLPSGVSSSAKVRCPLCRSQYTLADALVNMPPLLEVIEDAPVGAPGNSFDLPADRGIEDKLDNALQHEAAEPVDLAGAHEAHEEAAPLADLGHSESAEEDLSFEAPEIEHDDLTMQEQDTEIEDLGFTTSDPLVREAPPINEHFELAGPDEESVLDLGQNEPAHDEPGHDPAADDGIEIDFDHVPSAEKPAVTGEVEFDFDAPEAAEEGEDEVALDFGVPVAAQPAAGESETELDFGDPIEAEPTPVAAADQPPPAEEKGKKKKNKPREKAPAKAGRSGSLVRTLVSLVVCSVVALPVALYGVLWISPDYDFFDVGRKLPAWAQPGNLAKSKFNKPIAVASIPQPAQVAPQQTALGGVEPAPAAVDSAAQGAPSPAPAQAVAAEPAQADTRVEPMPPAADAAASKSDDAPPEPPVADEPAVGNGKPEVMPAETPKKTGGDVGAVAGKPEPAQDAAEMPDESAAPVTDKPVKSADKTAADASTGELPSPFDGPSDAKPEEMPDPADAGQPAEAIGPRDAAQFTLSDLATAMQTAGDANEKMMAAQNSTDKDAIKKVRSQFYLSLYRLAEVLTFAQDDPANPQLRNQREQLQQVIMQFAEDEKRVEALGINAGRWLGYPKRTVSGIMLAGTVQHVEQLGKLYHIKMELASDKEPVSVTAVTPENPKLKPNDRALVLGSIVENPALQIAGYEGHEAAVVWSGMALPIPAAQ